MDFTRLPAAFRLAALFLFFGCIRQHLQAQNPVFLIAHRGGVVDSSCTENGFPALEKAAAHGYKMVEVDMRVTQDGVLIANHDADFRRFYQVDKKVTELDWQEIKTFESTLDGASPLLLEDIFKYCREKSLGVMLDNKIAGLDTALFNRVIALLDKYQLRGQALMIGTDESTGFFTGKVRLSCSRAQLEENQKKPGYDPAHYFLFERPARLTREDVAWAAANRIMTVAAINKFHYRQSKDMRTDAAADCRRMQEIGVERFQVDSEFAVFFEH